MSFRFIKSRLSAKSAERQPLATTTQLENVLIEQKTDSNLTDTVSKPFNEKYGNRKEVLYDEIVACLSILKDSKKNLASFQEQELKRIRLITYFNILFFIAVPGGSLTLMMKMHEWLTSSLSKTFSLFMVPLTNVTQHRDALNREYNQESSKYRSWQNYCDYAALSDKFQDFLNIFKYCGGTYDDIPWGWHGGQKLKDVCALPRDFPIDKCNQNIDDFCAIENNTFACIDEFNRVAGPESARLKDEFQPQIASYNEEISRLQKALDSLDDKTWDPASTAGFTMITIACIAWLIFIFKDWRQSYLKYADDLKHDHEIDECLHPNHLMRIINLCATLKINLKDITLEKLISDLETIKANEQNRESICTFFKVAKDNMVCKECFEEILDKTDLDKKSFVTPFSRIYRPS